jgi:hypothetical protein
MELESNMLGIAGKLVKYIVHFSKIKIFLKIAFHSQGAHTKTTSF